MKNPNFIAGGFHEDRRGRVSFINEFDATAVRRCYWIQHPTTDTVRAWQGHRLETKWFVCTRGGFEVRLIEPDNWETPSKQLPVTVFSLTEKQPGVLWVPPGFVTGFRATKNHSTLMVYSDVALEASVSDDYRFDPKTWIPWTNI